MRRVDAIAGRRSVHDDQAAWPCIDPDWSQNDRDLEFPTVDELGNHPDTSD